MNSKLTAVVFSFHSTDNAICVDLINCMTYIIFSIRLIFMCGIQINENGLFIRNEGLEVKDNSCLL